MVDVPKYFIPEPSPAVASYSYTDIQAGTGVQNYYGSVSKKSGVFSYILSPSIIYSNDIVLSGAAAPTSPALLRNDSYDVTFNKPQNIKGMSYLTVSVGGTSLGGGTAGYIIVSGASINKWDGTTLTNLGTAYSDLLELSGGVGTVTSYTLNLPFDLTSQVYHFKKGDILRLTLPVWISGASGAQINGGGYGVDPKDRTDKTNNGKAMTISGGSTTQMILSVPFVLDIN